MSRDRASSQCLRFALHQFKMLHGVRNVDLMAEQILKQALEPHSKAF